MVRVVSEGFRRHPGREASGKTAIRGESSHTADELRKFAERRRLKVGQDCAEAYLRLGREYGIKGDIAFCQSLYEARTLAEGRVRPVGEARWTDLWGVRGRDELFAEPFIERQMQLLYGFATADPLPEGVASVAPNRFASIEAMEWRGGAPHWEDLNGKWSSPGARYGEDIVSIWRNLAEWAGNERRRVERYNRQRLIGMAASGAGNAEGTGGASAAGSAFSSDGPRGQPAVEARQG